MKRSVEQFEEDLNFITNKLCNGESERVCRQILRLRDKLISLYERNLVKINHSVMELICAKYLILSGYQVDVEYALDGISCDIYALKGLGSLIVEVETGYVPPEHAVDPMTYCLVRVTSKIVRYSKYAEKFALATPPYYTLCFSPALIKPPRYRTPSEIREIKALCDLYYTNPPVTIDEIRNARLHVIYIIDVDKGIVRETDPNTYFEKAREIYEWWEI
ncbi:MAG: hypothetical protein QXS10_06500 [Candidatus Bathyarchaeia archaeon]|nr:hypothetical protein [Candidatus Bathyarchaeota archaeon]